MEQSCAECVRLWDEYLAVRKQHTAAMKRYSEAEGEETVKAAALGKTAYEAKERIRAELTAHEEQMHGNR